MITTRTTVRLLIAVPLVFGLVFGAVGDGKTAQSGTGKSVNAPEKYPTKSIKIVVTHAAGSANDMPSRLVQPYLSKALGVPVVIENMVGASGGVARAYVYKAPPDGYTLLGSGQPGMSISAVTSGAQFDPLKFTPIYGLSGQGYNAIAVPYDSPFKTGKDIIDTARIKVIPTGCAGIGGTGYLCIVLMKEKHGAKLQYIPYDGGNEVAMAVAGNQIPMCLTTFAQLLPLHQQKKLRLIAILADKRSELAPDIPTLTEQGYPGIETDDFRGIYAPPGLPQYKIDILAAAFDKATKDPDYIKTAVAAAESLKLQGPVEFAKEFQKAHEQVMENAVALKAATKK